MPTPEITPLAGAVFRPPDGEPWRISASEDGSACTILRSLTMTVPVGDDPHDAYVRLHELAHARFSPLTNPPDHVEAFERMEEVRINQLVQNRFRTSARDELRAGQALRAALLQRIRERKLSKRRIALNLLEVSEEEVAAKAPEMFGFADFEGGAIGEMIRQIKRLAGTHANAVPSPDAAEANAGNRQVWMALRRYAAIFDRIFPTNPNELPTALPPMPELLVTRRKRPPTAEELLLILDELAEWELVMARRRQRPFNISMFDDIEEDAWGQMLIETPPLPVKTGASRLLQPRPSDLGHRVKRIHRLLTDQMVFQTKVRYRGGTLLLDCSGSMTLKPADIDGLLGLAPAATIATYAGDGIRQDIGWLRVVAKNGMRCGADQLEFPGFDNLIDGPALRWLATQPKPRFWISDELATGRDGVTRTFLVAECKAICQRYQIRNFKTIDSAVRGLRLS